MYVPAWPGLTPGFLVQRKTAACLPFPLGTAQTLSVYAARYAIYHLFRALGFGNGDTVLVPDYHHGNEVRAMRATGATVRYYPIMRNLEPDLDALMHLSQLEPRPRALFVIHFLGWPQPIEALTALCRARGMILIEDCALALLSEVNGRPLGTFGDYAVFCLYKTLPLPHGGVLVQNGNVMPELARMAQMPCGTRSLAGRVAELFLEWLQGRVDAPARLIRAAKRLTGRALTSAGVAQAKVGDEGFDLAAATLGMSPFCNYVLQRLDYAQIRRRRRENYALLCEELAGGATVLRTDLPDGVCPLFLPLVVGDKASAAHALQQCGISTVQFWNHGDPASDLNGDSDARFLRRHVLELPIHQDVSAVQIAHMAKQVRSLGLRV